MTETGSAGVVTDGGDGGAPSAVLGVDSGGSGLRAALAVRSGTGTVAPSNGESTAPVRTGPGGIDPGHLLELLVPMARKLMREAGVDGIGAVAIGAAGMATLGARLRAELPCALARELGVRRLALAADAVTAYAGALGSRPGAIVAAGTGMIALGTDLKGWLRADGWGHLLGDCGGGAWIGRAGLEAAMRAYDGRRGGSSALLARAEKVFGPAAGLPGQLYPRTDRPAVLASFAPEVAACAAEDPVAEGILRDAARHIAEAAAAVCPASGESEVALTGGLFHMGEPLLAPVRAHLARLVPQARQVSAEADPLQGAVRMAVDLALDRLALPHDEHLLCVVHLPAA
ncbi:N-acetylglucosamine kinase [Streptomyces jeddahensis]|uniref:BadF/BadG/BcrA/BcrD ATPase family protein n=1 Tax=Streptomyces jeddahensis TaxID=1716141 RepID=A0A177HHM7_9ACTN|nr:BadF/BadG/BcrA/BcrD ATPase family protein [Streptomyces jeddahensis]OAH10452.1 BadF/BadG/BcrA/BcrD ATPase family protein [Streptomyces jeddahensis]